MKRNIKQALLVFLASAVLSVPAIAADEPDADNTKKNAADRSGASKTSGDQSNTPEDLKITQSIRKAIVKDGSLTITAKNVKIITANGRVMLRGPVNSAEEKTKIESFAKAAAGEGKVDNQLEVKAAK
jgi:hyperosmotically inducible periplasmic protein